MVKTRTILSAALLAFGLIANACSPAATELPTQPPTAPLEPTAVPPTDTPEVESTSVSPTNTPEPEPYPQTHMDVLDREVTIVARPGRIVSLAPSVTEILFAIGAGPQLVGRTEYDNYPPEVESLPTIGGFSTKSISVETILDLEPHLVIAGSRLQAEIVEALAGADITVFALAPESLAEIEAAVLTLGQVTGNVVDAEALVAEMQLRTTAVTERVAAIPPEDRVTVFYEVWHEPLMTTTEATFIGELIALAGGANIFSDLEEAYPSVSAEQILELDPQVILGPSSHGDQLTPEAIAARPGWDNLTAVQNGAIYLVDGDIISRPGPRVVEALENIAALLYPDLFGE